MVYVFHVDGYEDTELIAPLDMLSRAGIPFTRVGVTGKTITSKLGFTIEADITPEQLDLSDCEMIFLPVVPEPKIISTSQSLTVQLHIAWSMTAT